MRLLRTIELETVQKLMQVRNTSMSRRGGVKEGKERSNGIRVFLAFPRFKPLFLSGLLERDWFKG